MTSMLTIPAMKPAAAPGAPPASAPAPAVYLANLAALYRRAPALAAQVDRLPFADLPALERTRDGHVTAQIPADDGQLIYLHSQYRPTEEAQRLVEALDPEQTSAVCVCGVGLGYLIPLLNQRLRRPLMIVAEHDLALIKAALCLHNLAPLIEQGRLLFVTTAEKHALTEQLSVCNADLLLGTRLITPPYARRRGVAFFAAVQKFLTEYIAFGRMQMVTLLKVARVTFKNVSSNLPEYLRSPGVAALQGRAAGYPAIVVAAGPSLARQIEGVLALRERAVVIAVQTVFKLMHALGRTPHFVTSLDFHEVSAGFFEGISDARDCVLVAEPKVPSGVLDLYPGRKVVLNNGLYQRLLRGGAPQRGNLKPGSTVAHLAFYLAQHLGCDPILLVGQDLCFSEGLFYPPGTPVERIWQPELGRFQTVEMKQWERIVRNRGILKRIKDVQGRATYSDELLLHYAEQFQADFARSTARVVQIGSTGLPLDGTEVMSLADAAAQFCTRPLPSGLLDLPAAPPVDTRAVCSALESRLSDVREVKRIATEMSGLLAELATLTDRPNEFNRRIVRVDALRSQMDRLDEAYGMVVEVSQTAELRRYQADRQLGESALETAETVGARLRRDREFVAEFLDGCAFLERVLPDVLARARERLA